MPETPVPEGVRRLGFCYGAYWFPRSWARANGVDIETCPPGRFECRYWLGLHGYELLWRQGRFADAGQLKRAMRRWDWAAWVAMALITGLLALSILMPFGQWVLAGLR